MFMYPNHQQDNQHLFVLVFQDLENRIAQEEDTGQALKVEALRQENVMQQLRIAVKEVVSLLNIGIC